MSALAAAESPLNESKRPLAKARIISARVTETEYAALEKEAWAAGKTIGDWTIRASTRRLVTNLSAIGWHMNTRTKTERQLARWNTGQAGTRHFLHQNQFH